MKKRLVLIVALLAWFCSGNAFAAIGLKQNDTPAGSGAYIDCDTTDIGCTISGNDIQLTLGSAPSTTGNLVFQTSLYATGRRGVSSTIPSSSNGINPSTLPYSLLIKSIGNVAGETATLPAGTDGQILTIYINGCGPSGTWIVSRLKGSGWTTMTFNGRDDQATLLYDSNSWLDYLSTTSVTVAATAL